MEYISSPYVFGFLGLLTIVFIVLKLTKVINWKWFWVVSPTILGICLAIIIVGIAVYAAVRSN